VTTDSADYLNLAITSKTDNAEKMIVCHVDALLAGKSSRTKATLIYLSNCEPSIIIVYAT